MAHDVFISHSAKDHAIASQVCDELENEGIQCWIAPRDIMPGTEWGEAIIDAIGDSRLMILIFSSNANTSKPTIREVERAEHREILVIPFRIENVAPAKSLEYFISTSHWFDAFTPPLEQHLKRLATVVKSQLARQDNGKAIEATPRTPEPRPSFQAALAGRYVIEREIGRGGTATIFLARDLRNRRAVAIKTLNPEVAHVLGADRFLREIEIAANLNHPRIVPLFDSGEAEGVLYYVMPYVEGESLQQRLRRQGRLPEEEALRIGVEIASALSYAHKRGVIHRDIKPGNILFSGGEAVVADFGIARALSAAAGEDLTQTGLVIGTPAYMSPEQATGEPVDGRSDIYSLGCVLYEMLAGEPPFSGPSTQAVITKRLGPPPSLRRLRPTVSAAIEQVVMKALAQSPADRFTTATELGTALTRAADHAQEAASVTISPPPINIEPGDSFTLTASVRDAAGVVLPEREVRWTSSDHAIATTEVSQGFVTALAPGSVTISASTEQAKGSLSLTVMPTRVAIIHISVPPVALCVGKQIQLTVSVEGRFGVLSSRPVTWTSSDISVATVSTAGLVSGVAPGRVTIIAEAEGVRGTASLSVLPAPVATVHLAAVPEFLRVGESFRLTKTLLDTQGNKLDDRQVAWMSSDRSVAPVSSDGIVTARAPGVVSLSASCEGITATATVTIRAVPVATVALSRPPAVLSVGRRFRLKATPRDAAGGALNSAVEWQSSEPAIAVVSRDGMVAALQTGEADITAMAGGVHSTVRLRVTPAIALGEKLSIAASRVAQRLGQLPKWWWTIPAVAALVFLWPFVRSRPVPFPDVAPETVKSDTVKAETAGPATESPAMVAVDLSDPQSPLQVGDTITLSATLRDESGAPLHGRTFLWRSSDPRVAAVGESTGTITAASAGSAVIVAESGEERDSVTLVVRRVPVASVMITTRSRRNFLARDSMWLRAVVRDARSHSIEGRKVTWMSSNPQVATVDALTGWVRTHTGGSTTIIATSEGRRDTVSISVTATSDSPSVVAAPRRSDSINLEAQVRRGVSECLNALKSNNAARMAELYKPLTDNDRKKEHALMELMRTRDRKFSAVNPVYFPPRIFGDSASAEFGVMLQWRSSFGGKREQRTTFRSELDRAGDGVRLTCRIVGSTDLD